MTDAAPQPAPRCAGAGTLPTHHTDGLFRRNMTVSGKETLGQDTPASFLRHR